MLFPLYDNNPTERTSVATYALLVTNVLVFLWMGHLDTLSHEVFVYKHGFVPARISQLSQPHPISVPIEIVVRNSIWGPQMEQRSLELQPVPSQIWLSLFTCMFMHASWMHLLGNMWFLWLFGNNVENRLGMFWYLVLYLIGGLLGSAAHWVADPSSVTPLVGASGAIAAVLGAYAITWPWARISTLVFLVVFVTIIEIPALLVLGAWFIYQVAASQQSLHGEGGEVAWWAHIGGFLAGMILMPIFEIFKKDGHTPPSGTVLE